MQEKAKSLNILIVLIFGIVAILAIYYTIKLSRRGMHYLQNINLRQDYLRRFVKLIFTEDLEEIIDHFNQTKRKPHEFVATHPEIFRKFGVDKDDADDFPVVFKAVMMYHLQSQNNLQSLDFKQSGQKGLDSLNYLLSINEIPLIQSTDTDSMTSAIHKKYLDYDSAEHLSTQDLIIHVSRMISSGGHTFIEMNLGGDSYDLFIVSEKDAKEIIDLANKLGIDLWNMK